MIKLLDPLYKIHRGLKREVFSALTHHHDGGASSSIIIIIGVLCRWFIYGCS